MCDIRDELALEYHILNFQGFVVIPESFLHRGCGICWWQQQPCQLVDTQEAFSGHSAFKGSLLLTSVGLAQAHHHPSSCSLK